MKKKNLIALFLFLCLLTGPSFALDTDLYVLSGVNIPPNVLIILDSSASMDEVSSGQIYDPAIDYSLYSPPIVYPANAVYYKSGNKWTLWREHYDMITSCSDLKNLLILYGEAINYPVDLATSECGGNKKYNFQTGNFMNYLQLTGGPGGGRPRFGLATGIIHSYINTTNGVRFAVMAFKRDSAGNVVKYDTNNPNKGEFVYGDDQDIPLNADG